MGQYFEILREKQNEKWRKIENSNETIMSDFQTLWHYVEKETAREIPFPSF